MLSKTCISNDDNLNYFVNFIYTDSDAILIGKSNDFGTSLYIGEEINNIDGYYIRAENVFVKGKHMNLKYDKENKTIIISLEDEEVEEPDYLHDIIGDDDLEEHEDNNDVRIFE